MSKTFEKELPDGYREVKTVDAKNKKFIIKMNIAVILFMILFMIAALMIIEPTADSYDNDTSYPGVIYILLLPVYIVLHEIVHGIAYKVLTHQKLTFGMTLSVAFCGVPDIYVYRKTALIALLAPFTIFTVIFGAAIFLLNNSFDKLYMSFVFAVHFSGCFGDLYDAFLYLFKFKDPETLMRDTGPKQTFYIK